MASAVGTRRPVVETKAAVLWNAHEALKIETVTIGDLGPTEVLIKVMGSGGCGSDTHVIDGDNPVYRPPIVLGHEVAGIVEEVGHDVTAVRPGDHVVTGLFPGCGHCPECWDGNVRSCRNVNFATRAIEAPRLRVGGMPIRQMGGVSGFAQHSVVQERVCIKIREDAPFDRVCLVACGVTTGYGVVMFSARVTPGASAVVIGCGGVGLNVIQSLDLALATT